MRKYCAFLISFVALLVLGLSLFSVYAAKIVYVKGRVEVQPSSANIWQRAKKGTEINIGDSIRTARHSEAQVLLDESKKSFIDIAEQTLVIINSTSAGRINKLDLSHGKIFASVDKLQAGGVFEVSTPSSVAGVRGTSWSVASNSKRDEISVYKDSVFVEAYDKLKKLLSKITVPEGFKVIVERFGSPGELFPLNERDKREWKGRKKKFLDALEDLAGKGLVDMGALFDKIDQINDALNKANDIKEQLEDKGEESGIGDRGCEEGEGETIP